METLSHSNIRKKTAITAFFLLMCGLAFIELITGSVKIPFFSILNVFISKLFKHTASSSLDIVILEIRLPRLLLAISAGMALSVSGATFQGIFRNPLVSPYLLGVASGAAFGAALGFALSLPYTAVAVFAFGFGLLAVMTAYSISKIRGRASTTTLLLSGIIVSAFFFALTSLIEFIVTKEKLSSIVFWIMGGFTFASWEKVAISFPIIVSCILFIYLTSWQLNVISLGDEEAKSLGINIEKMRAILILLSTLIVAVIIAFTGTIGWIGLIVPHLARMVVGADHRYLLLASLFLGASFMVGADIIARTAVEMEIPVGIITSLVGAPFFIYLLVKRGTRTAWD